MTKEKFLKLSLYKMQCLRQILVEREVFSTPGMSNAQVETLLARP